MFDVVLFEPEIPPNTGNIIRLCANTGARLHLVEPLGFELEDRALRRAGLDYHEYTAVRVHPSLTACLQALASREVYAFSTRGKRAFNSVRFNADAVLLFGSETAGLPARVLDSIAPERCVRLPMVAASRSLNLANAVAIAVFEAWRQHDYAGAVHSAVDTDAATTRRK